MIRPHSLAIAAALAFTGCESVTTSHYQVFKTIGHRERVGRLLDRIARREGLPAVQSTAPRDTNGWRSLFAHYRSPFNSSIELKAFEFTDTIEARLSEHRSFGRNPSSSFDQLEQKLLHEFRGEFGSEVRFRTERQAPGH